MTNADTNGLIGLAILVIGVPTAILPSQNAISNWNNINPAFERLNGR